MRNFHLEDPKFSWTKVKVFGSCYKTSIHVNIFSPIESGLVLLLYIFCGNYLEILYLTNYSFFLLTDATNLYNLVAFSGSSLNHFHFLLDYGTNNCSFTITFFICLHGILYFPICSQDSISGFCLLSHL